MLFIKKSFICKESGTATEAATSVCNFVKKETLAHVFSCEFCKISKNTFLIEHLRVTASAATKLKLVTKMKKHNQLYFGTLVLSSYFYCGDSSNMALKNISE